MIVLCSDRCRTTNNLLGDCYGAAVVEALSKEELEKMDEANEEMEKSDDINAAEDLESAKALLNEKWEETTKVSASRSI